MGHRPQAFVTSLHPKVSFIVSTYQGGSQLDLSLSCLEASLNRDFEIILADDGSDAELLKPILSRHPEVRYVRQDNFGFRLSRARNLGVVASTGDILVFMDHDILVPPTFVDSVLRSIHRGWFLGGRRVKLDRRFSELLLSRPARAFPSWIETVWHSLRRRSPGTRFLFPMRQRMTSGSPQDWRGMAGFMLCVRRDDFLAVDGFDSSYVSYGVEDWDFMARLSNYGISAGYLRRRATVLHVWHPESEDSPNNPNYLKLARVIEGHAVMPHSGYRCLADMTDVVMDPPSDQIAELTKSSGQ